ncbi:MAG: MoaD/ThiS family protein [Lysobacterales bacterium]|jgi:molybdopterin converting factor subunit 1
MKLTVRYFALFRDQAGRESETVEWGGGTAAELFGLLCDRHPALQAEAAALVAVNDEMAGWDTALADGDEVLFFPPVAGG